MKLLIIWSRWVCLVVLAVYVSTATSCDTDECTFDLRMKNARPTRADQYLCSGYSVREDILQTPPGEVDEGYIVKFEAIADANTAHHILVFGCERAYKPTGYWSCGTVCEGKEQIIFAWAKNAPPLSLPKDVGRRIGAQSQINHIVVQIHYSKPLEATDNSGIRIYTTLKKQQFLAGIYLLLAYDTVIPADTPKVHADISCGFSWPDTIVPFGFRTHAHVLGTVISGYKVKDNKYTLIGKGNPQWPQAFYPVEDQIKINPGDILAARCTYNSEGRHRKTYIGSTADDEMCNFYIMYYTNATSEGKGPDTCAGNHQVQVFNDIPADSDTPLPPNPDLEDEAKGHAHHHHAMSGDNGESEQHQDRPDENIDGVVKPLDSALGDKPLDSTLGLTFKSAVGNFELGQVAGLDVGKNGELYIFHRGSRVWDSLSFDAMGNYQYRDDPVVTDPIIVVDRDGNRIRSFGKNRFFLPHGLTLDNQENVWVTDVALHQVFRLPKGTDEPNLTLGIKWEPGSDKEHFCKPTDVAVLSSGEFFVSDGYCNHRIMKFDRNGYFLHMWGEASVPSRLDSYPLPGMFNVPHALALAEEKNLLCVADRENGRIQCFNLNGTFVRQMHPKQVGETMYAVEYCPNHGGLLFAVNGPSISRQAPPVQGLTFNINTGALLSTWNVPNKGLTHPHDVTVDTVKHLVYVGELNPPKVWKFEMTEALYTAANSVGGVTSQGATAKPTPAPVITDTHDNSVSNSGSPHMSNGVSSQNTSRHSTLGVVNVVVTNVTPGVVTETPTVSHSRKPSVNDKLSGVNVGVATVRPVVVTETPSKPSVSLTPKASTVGVQLTTASVDDGVAQSGEVEQPSMKKLEEKEDFAPSLIIGMLLVVPVIILVTVTILIRLYHTGYFRKCAGSGRSKRKYNFNLGNFLNSHKGFDRLSTEDDDHDLDNALDDSDNEEFSIVRKA